MEIPRDSLYFCFQLTSSQLNPTQSAFNIYLLHLPTGSPTLSLSDCKLYLIAYPTEIKRHNCFGVSLIGMKPLALKQNHKIPEYILHLYDVSPLYMTTIQI